MPTPLTQCMSWSQDSGGMYNMPGFPTALGDSEVHKVTSHCHEVHIQRGGDKALNRCRRHCPCTCCPGSIALAAVRSRDDVSNAEVLSSVFRRSSQPVQSPNYIQCSPSGTRQGHQSSREDIHRHCDTVGILRVGAGPSLEESETWEHHNKLSVTVTVTAFFLLFPATTFLLFDKDYVPVWPWQEVGKNRRRLTLEQRVCVCRDLAQGRSVKWTEFWMPESLAYASERFQVPVGTSGFPVKFLSLSLFGQKLIVFLSMPPDMAWVNLFPRSCGLSMHAYVCMYVCMYRTISV